MFTDSNTERPPKFSNIPNTATTRNIINNIFISTVESFKVVLHKRPPIVLRDSKVFRIPYPNKIICIFSNIPRRYGLTILPLRSVIISLWLLVYLAFQLLSLHNVFVPITGKVIDLLLTFPVIYSCLQQIVRAPHDSN